MNETTKMIAIGFLLVILLSASALAGETLDRTKRPPGKPAPVIQLPAIQKTKLHNGLAVWLVEQHELPTVSFNLVVQSGSDHDPLDRPGLASLTADMLDEGTKTRDALQIADALESLGATMNTNASLDGSFLALNTLTKHLDAALDVYLDVLLHPTFPEKDFERVRKQRLTTLVQQHDQPTSIANNAYSFILYGAQHPYGNNPAGTETSLHAMTREELSTFYATYYRPNNATLIVVGDVKLSDITSKLEATLASWAPATIPPVAIPAPKPIDSLRVYLVDKPEAAQSEIRIGYPALARSTPDYFPVLVMNRMLGGQFTSRINLNLREKHGFTYGARSAFSFQKAAGPFTASAGVVTDKSDSSVAEFLNELHAMHDKGMTEEELAYVKKGLIGGFALSFETPAQIAAGLQNLVLYDLPDNYFENFLKNIDGVSLDQVREVAKRYLDTSRMAILVVGDLAKIRGNITAMNFGTIVLCDVDGKPLP
jgi:zinc protease